MKVIVLRFGELFLKGGNKKYFERTLISNIKICLEGMNFEVRHVQGRITIENYAEQDEAKIIDILTKVFGLVGIARAEQVESKKDKILEAVKLVELNENKTFRVTVKRAWKGFEINSTNFSKLIGDVVCDKYPNIKVDLYNPNQEVFIDIRTPEKTYIYTENIVCSGGLPYGTGGKGLALLSGGIDSPVAVYMMAKRGMEIECLHFESYPYTSVQAQDKVLTLAKIVSAYTNKKLRVHIISLTKIQEAIHMNCDSEFMITIMRRMMMRIAEIICKKNGLQAIITGECLGQVASQTIESIMVTNSTVSLPVLRPLIGFDKEEIIEVSKKIGTFNTSILPYEDCCTVFLPKNPVIKPTIKRAVFQEKHINVDDLVASALETEKIIDIS